jgi:hypothetical protein
MTRRLLPPSPAFPPRGAALALVVAGAGSVGCETVSQDISDFTRSLAPPSPSEAARMALDPHDADHRREGTLLLANASFGGAEVYVAMYRDYVDNEPNPLVKAVAIRALGRHGAQEDARRIARHLRHENRQVRWEAAKALQRIHDPSIIADLLAVTRNVDESTDVRVATVVALGQYPQDRVFQGLVAALNARDLAVNVAAERSLRIITGESFGMNTRTWLAWYANHPDDPFAGGLEYLYPTYSRDSTFLEKLAFWAPRVQEEPGLPIGLGSKTERRTYDDDDEVSPPEPEPSAAPPAAPPGGDGS